MDVCDSWQTFCGSPKRTILLIDIKDIKGIMDEEDVQDIIEFHFQKTSNRGGEIESIKYVSGEKALQAFFCEDPGKRDDWYFTSQGQKLKTATKCKTSLPIDC